MPTAIPDHLAPDLDILFVGFNPSLKSGETGHHYANPHNRFWKILHLSGLTPRLYRAEEDRELLKLGYGFTNIVERPTQRADQITKEEYRVGRLRLMQKIADLRPRVVCFVGKGVYLQYSGKKSAAWGLQESSVIPGVQEFVAPSSSGLVRMKLDEIVAIYAELARLIKLSQ
ncbi:mismatch-specific DNA-glycosylase [Laceyella sacchari]|uniref:G/U mismatch-specific uracil-DNA glycosylase n=1 Tax=Laceyella tengchongensis TaxID=574699 RepID=A0AA46AD46_9BACL|nr:mismatch-specific DNA-glycosylase [Laceyella tengchongensis]AUS08127.1 mismatch-specific DNA-glycosylase [Laceyella sacchari]SMP02945.1 G/U mismatch-specific uracil-DNA glycosylase [Laceyella tengchongensis]